MEENGRITIDYYTDMLCIWACFGQVKVDELKARFGGRVELRYRFIPLFGCCEQRIGQGWETGGFDSRGIPASSLNWPGTSPMWRCTRRSGATMRRPPRCRLTWC